LKAPVTSADALPVNDQADLTIDDCEPSPTTHTPPEARDLNARQLRDYLAAEAC